jgi:hypothetical protein
VLIAMRAPAVWADVRAVLAHELRLPWLGGAAAAEVVLVAGLVMAQRQLLTTVIVYRVRHPPAAPGRARQRPGRAA